MGAFGCMGHALVRDKGSILNYLSSIVSLVFRKENIPLISLNYARLYLKNYILDFSCNILIFFLDQIHLKELCRDSTFGQNLWFHPDYTLGLYIHRCLNEKTLENLYVWMFFQVIGARQAIQATFLVSVDNQNSKESTSL